MRDSSDNEVESTLQLKMVRQLIQHGTPHALAFLVR